MNDNKKLDIIKKLLAKSEGTNNAHESAAFLAKAQQLMADAGITEQSVKLSDVGSEYVRSQFSTSKLKSFENELLWVISQTFGCKLIWCSAQSWNRADHWAKFRLIGLEDKVKLAAYTATVLTRKLMAARVEYVKTLPDYLTRAEKIKKGDGFCVGWVRQIRDTVQVFAGVPDIVETAFANIKVDGEAKSQKRNIDGTSYYDGITAAKGESLFKPMSEAEKQKRLA